MRPTKLTMSAFGPYANKTIIDFDKLGSNGIYIICGDTGAGKTTIFDAIKYALYGTATCERKTTTMLRSKYANPSTITYVELEFIYNNKKYIINRIPEQDRMKTKGEGITHKGQEVTLTYPDGRIENNVSQVNASILEILGVTNEQFSNIALIAQGDFLKLINAKTEDREKIFRDIFKTKIYSDFQNKINEKYNEEKKQIDNIKSGLHQYIEGIECDVDNKYYVDINNAKTNKLLVTDLIPILEDLVKDEELEKNNLEKKTNDIDDKINKLNDKIGQSKKIKEAQDSLKQNQKLLKENNLELEKLDAEYKKANIEAPKIKSNEQEITILEESLPEYERLDDLLEELEEINDELEDNKSDANNYKEKIAELEKQYKKAKQDQDSLKDTKVNLEKLTTKLDKENENKENLDDLINNYKNYKDSEKDLNSLQNEYKTLQIEEEKLSDNSKKLRKLYNSSQAGILAEELEDGKPCPVCGSTNHPRVAVKPKNIPTLAEVEEAEEKVDSIKMKVDNASKKANKLIGEVSNKFKALQKDAKKLIGIIDINQINIEAKTKLKDIKLQIDEITKSLKLEQNNSKKLDELDINIPKLEKEIEFNRQNLEKSNNKVTQNTEKQNGIKKEINNIKKNLIFDTEDEVNDYIEKLNTLNKDIQSNIDETKRNLDECKAKITQCKANIDSANLVIKDSSKTDINKLLEELEELDNQKQSIKHLYNNTNSDFNANKKALTNIKKLSNKFVKLEKNYQTLSLLNKTANGNLVGKNKIKFETYVQMFYFDRIIKRATVHLMKMTNSKYDFVREDISESSTKKGKTGLNLAVTDHTNGTTRSVASLSGGESFIASLSLALGLSEEISASAGGIRLDTMFVDEGFGSLDDDTLSTAINTLNSLSENNRLIGVISHVAEFKRRVNKQIVVSKKMDGTSEAKINIE